jgi:hypothetical protein
MMRTTWSLLAVGAVRHGDCPPSLFHTRTHSLTQSVSCMVTAPPGQSVVRGPARKRFGLGVILLRWGKWEGAHSSIVKMKRLHTLLPRIQDPRHKSQNFEPSLAPEPARGPARAANRKRPHTQAIKQIKRAKPTAALEIFRRSCSGMRAGAVAAADGGGTWTWDAPPCFLWRCTSGRTSGPWLPSLRRPSRKSVTSRSRVRSAPQGTP